MQKKWENLSIEEKIEVIREDILDISGSHNALDKKVGLLMEKVQELQRMLPKT